jgi:hypothetical protein
LPICQIKRWSDERQRKIYYVAWGHHGKKQSKHFSPFSGYRHGLLGLNRGRNGAGKEVYRIMLLSTGSQRCGLVAYFLRIDQAVHGHDKKVIVVYGVASTLVTRCLSISTVPPGVQGGCKVTVGENSSE